MHWKTAVALLLGLSILLVSCSSTKTVLQTGSKALSVSLYSDAEFESLKPGLKHIDDVYGMPQAALMVPDGSTVSVLKTETLPIRSDVAPPVDWPFERIRVLDGPAAGHEGWVSGIRVLDAKPLLQTVPR